MVHIKSRPVRVLWWRVGPNRRFALGLVYLLLIVAPGLVWQSSSVAAANPLPIPSQTGVYIYDWGFAIDQPNLVRLEPPQGKQYHAPRVSGTEISILVYLPTPDRGEVRVYRAVRPGLYDSRPSYEVTVTRAPGPQSGMVQLTPPTDLRRGEYWVGNPIRRIHYGAFYVYDNP